MSEHTHEDFIALIQERVSKRQYDELFSGGCCFHFALRSFKRELGRLAYIKAAFDPEKKGHVFVIGADERAFDRKGYRSVGSLKKEFGGWGDEQHFFATEMEIEADIRARPLPEKLLKAVFDAADEIISQRA